MVKMVGYIPGIIKEASRSLRKNMTVAEEIIWEEIKTKKLGYKFLRQKPIFLYSEDNGLGRYIIPDFSCLELKLILEIDGNVHERKEVYLLDQEKEKFLTLRGFKIIKIKNQEIHNNILKTIEKIVASFP